MNNNLNQLKIPTALALTAGASILMHDTSIDQATSRALTKPVDSLALSTLVKDDTPHDHVISSNTTRSATPRSQTRLSDEKKYIINKRLVGSNNDFDYIWPSV